MSQFTDLPILPFLLATYLGSSGVRKRSLSPSGGIAAFLVGFTMMAVPLKTFGVSLIVFYLVGSKATKVGKEKKAQLEAGHQEAGYRNAIQVLSNSFAAFVASALWSAAFAPHLVPGSVFSRFLDVASGKKYESAQWCPLVADESVWSRSLLYLTLGHFACCLGDTLASEIGILSRSPPRLITTLKVVPPGTNGGMSLTGTLASLAGGLIMGVTMAVTLLIESSACRAQWSVLLSLLTWGAFAGVLGSLIDSLLGATIQRTSFSNRTKQILTDESGVPSRDADIKVISGINILSNNQVNLVSSILTALILGYLA